MTLAGRGAQRANIICRCVQAIGDDLIDSIIGENIPILTEEALYNEAMLSSVKRIDAVLSGEADPGPPARKDAT